MKKTLVPALFLAALLSGCTQYGSTYVEMLENDAMEYWYRLDRFDSTDTCTSYSIRARDGNCLTTRNYSSSGVPANHDSVLEAFDSNNNATQTILYDSGTGIQSSRTTMQWAELAGEVYYITRSDTYGPSNVLEYSAAFTKTGNQLAMREYNSSGLEKPFDSTVSTFDGNGIFTETIFYDPDTGAQLNRYVMQSQPLANGKYCLSRMDSYDGSDTLIGYEIGTKTGLTVATLGYSAAGVPDSFNKVIDEYDSLGNLIQKTTFNPATGGQVMKMSYTWIY